MHVIQVKSWFYSFFSKIKHILPQMHVLEYFAFTCVISGVCLSLLAGSKIMFSQTSFTQHLPDEPQASTVEHKEEKTSQLVQESVVVSIVGAIKHPGVYTFTPEQRVADAIASSGGF